MKRIKLDNHEYIVSRIRPGRTELVSTTTGELRFVRCIDETQVYSTTKPMVPESQAVPFHKRNPDFIQQLQIRRAQILAENIKTRKNHKGSNPDKTSSPRKARASSAPKRKSGLQQALEFEMSEKLEGMSPQQKAVFEKMMKGKLGT